LDNANGAWGGLNRWTDRLEIISSNAIGFSAGGTVGANHMWITSDGKVGIGTATPATNLHVQGGILSLIGSDPRAAVAAPYIRAQAATGFSSNPIYSFWYQSDTGMSNPAAQTIAFVTAGTERMRITSDGNVGIGTSPSYKLDVNGNTRITGSLTVGGTALIGYERITDTIGANSGKNVSCPAGKRVLSCSIDTDNGYCVPNTDTSCYCYNYVALASRTAYLVCARIGN
jgi:hypothetical protein